MIPQEVAPDRAAREMRTHESGCRSAFGSANALQQGVALWLRCLNFGIVNYDHEEFGFVWIRQTLAVWVDREFLQLRSHPDFFQVLVNRSVSGRYFSRKNFQAACDSDSFFTNYNTKEQLHLAVCKLLGNWEDQDPAYRHPRGPTLEALEALNLSLIHI